MSLFLYLNSRRQQVINEFILKIKDFTHRKHYQLRSMNDRDVQNFFLQMAAKIKASPIIFF
jgi:hypothetical protein